MVDEGRVATSFCVCPLELEDVECGRRRETAGYGRLLFSVGTCRRPPRPRLSLVGQEEGEGGGGEVGGEAKAKVPLPLHDFRRPFTSFRVKD